MTAKWKVTIGTVATIALLAAIAVSGLIGFGIGKLAGIGEGYGKGYAAGSNLFAPTSKKYFELSTALLLREDVPSDIRYSLQQQLQNSKDPNGN